MGKVHFTQYLLPDGKTRKISIERPSDITKMANVLLANDIALDAEVLTTGEVSLSAHDPITEKTLAIEIIKNNKEIVEAVDRLIRKAFFRFNSPEKSGEPGLFDDIVTTDMMEKVLKKELKIDSFKYYTNWGMDDLEANRVHMVVLAFRDLINKMIAVELYDDEIVISGIVWDLNPNNDIVDEASQFHKVWKDWTKRAKEQYNLKGSWDYFKEKNVLFFKIRRNRS